MIIRNNISLLLLRLVFGGLMAFVHGLPKLDKLLGGAPYDFADPVGLGPGISLFLAVFAEFVCALLLIFGLGTRIVVVPLILTMLVAIVQVHGADPLNDKEMAILYLAAFIVLLLQGGGKFSIDQLFSKKNTETPAVFWLLLLLPALALTGCRGEATGTNSASFQKVQGETMGTTYNVTFRAAEEMNWKPSIDSLLERINLEVSTYIPTSLISRFNQASRSLQLDSTGGEHLLANYLAAREVFERTGGAFDPTVMPLVNYWGFGYQPDKRVEAVDSQMVDSLVLLVGMEKVKYDTATRTLKKALPGVELDFSALAKGYAADQIGRWLTARSTGHFLAEIGGEVVARGVNPQGKPWRVGINEPVEGAPAGSLYASLDISGKALATSGNYRNYYELDGVKYSHTINPRTGYPERSPLLSATVIADHCMQADAYATACMVVGLKKARELVKALDMKGYFIYSDDAGVLQTEASEGLPVNRLQ